MEKNIFRILILLLFVVVVFSCNKDEEDINDPNQNPPAMTARDSAKQDYNDNYLGSAITDPQWTGNATTCSAGTVSHSSDVAVMQRLNYFRRMVGLNDNCTLDTSLTSQEQQAALMMTANNQLSHSPPNTWSCYTQSGRDGAATSNLTIGASSSAGLWQFINDYGANNYMVGHRRWVLHSLKQRFSYGSTSNVMALYVFFNDTNTHIPAFIAYPPKGFIPQTLMSSRWSFSIPNANFAAATVTMSTSNGTDVPCNIVSRTDNGYGDNTIVWEPTGIDATNNNDVVYNVTVSGINAAAQSTYTYSTTIFKP